MLVMYDFYSGYDVYLVANLQLVGNIAESFVKFIQQRYGINCYLINTPEDLLYAVDTGAGFSMEGIGNFDLDKERLSTIAMASTQTDPRMANSYYGFILASNENGTENININPGTFSEEALSMIAIIKSDIQYYKNQLADYYNGCENIGNRSNNGCYHSAVFTSSVSKGIVQGFRIVYQTA